MPHQVLMRSTIASPDPCKYPLLLHHVPAVPPSVPLACHESLLLPCQYPRLLQNYFCRATASVTVRCLAAGSHRSRFPAHTHTHTYTCTPRHTWTHTHNHPIRAPGGGGCTLHVSWCSAVHAHTHTNRDKHMHAHTQRVASAEFISPSIFTNAANQVALQAEKTHPRHSAMAEHPAKAFAQHS